MMTRTHHQQERGRIRLSLFFACLLALAPLAPGQDAAPAEETPGTEIAQVDKPLRFNFENAAFDEVINYFSRAAGVPVIRETDVPGGTLTYLSPRSYDLAEGLRVLNTILQTKGLYLRRDSEFLYLGKLEEMSTEAVETFIGEGVPDDVTEDQIITVVVPLENLVADAIAEQLKPLVAPYGKLLPLPQQNALVLTETAANCRRLQKIIGNLDDDVPPANQSRLFALKYAQAPTVLQSLKVLAQEQQTTFVISPDGKKVKVDESKLEGLRLEADARTNSIIAVGPESRLSQIGEFIQMLDVPDPSAAREMATFSLHALSPSEAVRHLNQLFSGLPKEQQPTILPLDEVGKLTLVGDAGNIVQATSLLQEIDGVDEAGGAEGEAATQPRVSVIPVAHTNPQGAMNAVKQLLNSRQQRSVKMVPAPDNKALIVSGSAGDVDTVRSLLNAMDIERPVDREVRIVQVTRGEPQQVLSRAKELYELQADTTQQANRVEAHLDAESRALTLIGTKQAIDQFYRTLSQTEQGVTVERETRTYQLRHAAPSQLTRALSSLAKQLLEPTDGSAYEAPTFEAVEPLESLLVRATPAQFEVIDGLIETLDAPQPGDTQFRILPVDNVDPKPLVERTRALYDAQVANLGGDYRELTVEIDAASGNLLLTGSGEAIRQWTDLMNQVRQLVPPQRTTEMIELRQARVSQVLPALQELIDKTDPVDPSRQVPAPTLQAVERTNSLLVTAERAQHALVRDLVSKLDVLEPGELPPLRLLQIRAADAQQIAKMLMDQYSKRSQEDRREKPVDVRADAATNTLIVSAHEDLFAEIMDFVETLNQEATTEADRVTEIYPLKVARAEDLAAAMDKLYPTPPIPRDRRGDPMPWLAQPKEVNVSADAGSNSLIVDAPASRIPAFEALVEKLDRVELPPSAELRTYRVTGGDPRVVAQTLQNLAKQGTLSAPPQPGKKQVQVTIDHEPLSKTLIVAGDTYTFEQVEAVLADLQAVPVERELRVIPITGTDPEEVRTQALAIYESQTEQLPDAEDVDVTIDSRSNSLMVVAAPEAMVRFLSIVDELQQTLGPPQDIQLYKLQHADAAEIVNFLTDLLESSQPFRTATGRDPIIEAIEANNSLLIAADETQHAIIRALVDSMDVISTDELPPLRILQLRTADAANLAQALSDVYDRRPSEQRAKMPVSIRADANSNTLLVSAHPELFAEIEQIVADLNLSGGLSREGREIRIFPLKFARAEELASTIDEMYPEPPVPVDYRGRPIPQARQPREVRVRADKFTNSIIVDAPVQRMTGFEQLVTALDKREIPEDIEMRTYTIVSAELNTVAQTVRKLAESGSLTPGSPMGAMSTPITVEVEPASRTLIVSGPQAMFAEIEKLLEEVDAQPDLPTMVMRFYKLEHTRADQIQDMLQQLLSSQIRETLIKEGSPESRVEALLEVTADPRSNTLIIRAPEWLAPVADQLIEQLDDPLAAVGRPIIRIIALTFAEADSVAASLTRTLPNIELPSGGSVQVLAAAGSNALILTGREKDLSKVEEMVQALDSRPSLDAINVETFALKYADAAQLAETVERLLVDQQMQDPRVLQYLLRYSRGPLPMQPQVQVEADARTNSLIVSARQQTLALAHDIIEQLDRAPDAPQREMAVFTPKRGRSTQLADLARRVLSETGSESLRERVELIAEPASTAVLVLGTETQIAEALGLLETFDAQAAAPPMMDLQIVDVQHVAAPALAQTLGPMLGDQNRWPEELRALASVGVSIARPTVAADGSFNRLLISAPAPLMQVARTLIAQLDAAPPQSGESVLVRVFPLTGGKAATVATTLQSALDAKLRAAATPVSAPRPVITAEPGSNTLVVTASEAQMAQVEALLGPLDVASDPEQMQVQTVYLKHARAENIAPVVEDLLGPEQIDSWIRLQSQLRGVELDTGPQVRVAAEPRLNAVVLTAPAGILKVAAEMVAQLDTDPAEAAAGPQRLVRVLSFSNADARELAANLEAVFDDAETSEAPPVIRVDTASNSLIVRGTETQLATIEEIAGQLDRATIASQRQMRMIPIDPSRANARELAETLQRILQDRGGADVEVISVEELMQRREGQSSSGETEEESRTVGALQEETGEEVHTLRPFCLNLQHAIVACVFAQTGAEETRTSGGDGASTEDPPLTIAVDEATNSLVVIGSPRLTDRLAQLAAEIQQQMPAEPGRVRIITLPQLVDARAIGNLLNATIRNIGQHSLDNPGGFTGRVAVIPDPEGGSIIVSANDTDFERVGDLIAALAQPAAAGEVVVKVYGLRTITAQQAAARVEDLVGQARGRQAQAARAQYMELEGEKFLVEPGSVQVVANPTGEQLIVAAPPQTLPLIDRFVTLIDQTSSGERVAIRRFLLENAEARAAAGSLQQAFDARRAGRGNQEPIRARFIADERTNSLLVAASDAQFTEVEELIGEIDRTLEADEYPLTIVAVQAALPSRIAQVAQEVVFAKDPGIRTRTTIVADDDSGLILVRAPEAEVALLKELATKLDQTPGENVPIRTIKVKNGDASRMAASINDFLDRRERIASQGRGRRTTAPKAAVVGDVRTGSLIIAADDEQHEQIAHLVETLDAEGGVGELQFRVYPLKHAQASDLRDTVEQIVDELGWQNMYGSRFSSGQTGDRIIVRVDPRLNAVIVVGQGDSFRLVESLIEMVDIPKPEGASVAVRIARLEHADLRLVQQAVQQAVGGGEQMPSWYYWPPRESTGEFTVHMDLQGRLLVFTGPQEQVEEAQALALQLDEAAKRPDQKIEVLNLAYAAADDVSRSLQQFFNDRARLDGKRQADVTIAGSRQGGTLLVSGTQVDLALVKDLVSRLDVPEAGEDRRIEVYALKSAQATDVSRVVDDMFPRSRGSRENDVIVSADARTNSLILSAPEERFAEVDALIERLDTTPSDEVVMVRTFNLSTGRADDVADILTEALDLGRSARGRAGDLRPIMMDEEGEPVRIKATITSDRRSNTLVISANPEAFPLLERMIAELDDQPYVNPRDYRVIHIKNVIAREISTTLRTLMSRRDYGSDDPPAITSQSSDNTLIISATSDQFQEIEGIIKQLDVPSPNPRITEFVPLKHAEAVQVREALGVFYGRYAAEALTPAAENTSIVADPATNSLVISSVEEEWPRIRELIAQLDSEEYDTSRQLRVIALRHADAPSVASAINAAFEIQVDRRRQPQDRRDARGADEEERDAPTLLVEPEEVVRVSAEPRSNSIIVSANLRNMERVESIVKTLDVADYAMLPPPQVIPLTTARAAELVNSLRQMYEQQRTSRGETTRRTIIIGHDTASNTIIVRAEEDEFAEIKALALALESSATSADVAIRIIPLKSARAARVLSVLQQPLQIKARQLGQPLSMQVDRLANSLVIATSETMFAEVEPVVKEMDALGPQLEGEGGGFQGRGVYIVPVEHVSPQEMQRLLESMGLTRQFRDDEISILTEPIQVQTLSSLRSLIVSASPIDRETVLRLVAQLDQAPVYGDQDLAIIPLRTATASTVASTLRDMIDPSQQDAQTPPADAIREQIRRLNLRQTGLDGEDLAIDLSEPIRILEDQQTNSIILSASAANIASLREIVDILDTLPIGDQVTIRIFHLDSADARQMQDVLRNLFQQGQAVSRALGSRRQTLPPTTTGYALAGEIGISTDERTNALIVAGREEAVALVEVLITELDSDEAARWVEPRVIQLVHADAVDLADTLRMILVEGQRNLPQSTAIQRQVSRLRIVREGGEPLTTDVFTPMSRLLIQPDDNMNALIVVGTTANVDAVAELVSQLDTPAASPNATVRIYPLEHGDAERVSRTIEEFFRDQERSGLIREEDAVHVATDQRTNTLIISTSPRSFTVLENLLETLDSATPNPTVGVHVVSVPGSDVERLADRIETIMRDRRAALGASATDSDRVSIQPDRGSNSLIIAASDDNLATIQRIIDLLTRAELEAAEQGKSFVVLPLKAAQAEQVVRTLRELYVDQINRTRGENTLSVSADERLNSVLVSGIAEDIAEIESLVKVLDEAPTHTVREIRILELKAANALEMESLLRSVLSGRSVALRGGTMRQATMLRFMAAKQMESRTGEELTEAQITSAIQEQISITPDVRTNALIVAAPSESIDLIEAIVNELDSSKGGDRKIEIFELVNADAEQMAELLAELFSLRQQGRIYILTPRAVGSLEPQPDEEAPAPPGGLAGAELTAVPDERQQLSITVDPRTNSLLVSGTERYMELVSNVITELDNKIANERETDVIRLKNAKAIEVAGVLEEFVSREQERILRLLGPDRTGSMTRRLEQEISVVGDALSNTVLLSASPRYIDTVRDIITELDAPPPQVMIQVVLAEVTLDSDFQWGMDINVGPFGNDEARASSSFGLGSAVATALGVPNLAVSTTDFSLLIRALQSQGRLEVLSRPQIAVANNEEANLQVGEEISLATSVRVNDNGSTDSTIEQRKLGIILNVLPSINDDGFVRLEVAPEFSNLSARTTQISEDFQAPVLNVRTIKTIVTVKDGQTVVIGGLIENRAERRNAKVPFFGDIPILGVPFRSEVVRRTKTELLVLLTPHILRQPDAYDLKTEHELRLLNIPEERKEVLRGSDFSDMDPFDFEADGPFLGEDQKRREDEPTDLQEEVEAFQEATDGASEAEQEESEPGDEIDETAEPSEDEPDPVPPALLHF